MNIECPKCGNKSYVCERTKLTVLHGITVRDGTPKLSSLPLRKMVHERNMQCLACNHLFDTPDDFYESMITYEDD